MEHAITPSANRFSFDIASTWALGLTVLLAAIAFIPSASIPFLYTKVSLLAVGAIVTLALFILARLTRGNIIVPPALLLGALWIVPIAYALSALFSGVGLKNAFFGTELEADTFGFMVLVALLGTLAALLLRRREQLRLFFLFGAAAAALVFLAELFFLIGGQIAPSLMSASANFIGSFGDLGIFTGLIVLVLLLALRFLELSRWFRVALMVSGGFSLIILALANSSLVWLFVGLAALGLFIEAIMHRMTAAATDDELEGVATLRDVETERESNPEPLIVSLIVLVVAIFFLIGGSIGSSLAGALHVNALDVRPSWSATFAVGGHTYASSPLFGTGPGTFGTDWLKFRDRSLNDTPFWNIDFTSGIGLVPTSFVTTGALGALAWIAFFGLLSFFGLRFLLMRAPEDPFVRFVSLASFVSAIYLFALSIFAVPGPVLIALAFVMTGVFISTLRYGTDAREWGIAFARSPRVGFVVVFFLTLLLLGSVASLYVVVERYLASVSYNQAAVALSSGNLTVAESAIARSILFAPSDRAYQLSSALGVAKMNQIASDTKLPADEARTQFQSTLSGSISDALTATQLGPQNYQNWAALGNVYASVIPLKIDGAYNNARTAYEHAVTLNPTNPALPYVLAQLDIRNKDNAKAEEDLNQAISLKHDYTQAIFLLSQLEVQEGKAKEALQAAEAAAYFAPTDPTVLFQVGLLRLGTGDTDGAIVALQGATKVNAQYANAHYFLAVAYATKKNYADAVTELNTVAALAPDNASAVATYITALQSGRNPFPATTLGTNPVKEPATP
jgi:tetratricopeptide (TPR) repeat protein